MFSEFSVRAQQWRDFATAHSRGLRREYRISIHHQNTFPQRIRAGCDGFLRCYSAVLFLCHSAFARVATYYNQLYKSALILCHSAFARVATRQQGLKLPDSIFATAHSRGLRLRKSNAAHCEFAARR